MTKVQVNSQGKVYVANGKALLVQEGSTPSGTLNITQNGTYDVTNYASANVNVSSGGSITPLNYQILYDSSISQDDFVAPTFTKLTTMGYLTYIELLGNIISPYQTSLINQNRYNTAKEQLKEMHLDALETITGAASKIFQTTFQDCTNLITLTFSNLVTVTGSCFSQMCKNCTSLTTVSFDKLSILNGSFAFGGTNAIGGAFNGCTSLATLSFPSLTSTSFGSYVNQFNMMLKGVTGCTVHFPSNLQSVIGSWSSVTSGFGGTNTIILFDLPATS